MQANACLLLSVAEPGLQGIGRRHPSILDELVGRRRRHCLSSAHGSRQSSCSHRPARRWCGTSRYSSERAGLVRSDVAGTIAPPSRHHPVERNPAAVADRGGLVNSWCTAESGSRGGQRSARGGRRTSRPRQGMRPLGYTGVAECVAQRSQLQTPAVDPPRKVGSVGTPRSVELRVCPKGAWSHGLSMGPPAVFRCAERSRAARRPTRTPITRSHSEMTLGPMMVSTREAVVGSPLKA
jgi:hypothetical protein